MVGEWHCCTWGDAISLEYGKALRGHAGSTGRYRVFGSNGPIGWTDQALTQGPGVILGRKGAYRGVEFSQEPFHVIDTAYYVVPRMELDMRWLYYAVKHYRLGEIDDGSPIPSTTRAAVYVQDLEIPPLPEQKRIAHILGTLDDKIELNRRMNATLEAMSRAIFKSWFVDFDPVRQKAAGQQPVGMDAKTAALFPDSFEDSEIGEVPNGWRVTRVADVTHRVTKGDTPRKSAVAEVAQATRMVSMIRVNAISEDGQLVYDNLVEIPEAIHFGKSKRSVLKPDYILYTNAGTIGRVAYVQKDWLPANTNQAVAIIQPKENLIIPAFLYMALRQPEFQHELHKDIVEAVQANLALGKIADSRLVLPPLPALKHLFSAVQSQLLRVWENQGQSRTLAALRDTLLPKLLSGEIRVREAEQAVEEATA
jgi:type I restriction enzyme S subunit